MIRHYATSWKVAGLKPDEVNDFFSIYPILPTALDQEGITQPLTEKNTGAEK
jgi:hypothetical protein